MERNRHLQERYDGYGNSKSYEKTQERGGSYDSLS
jgi:hypothetical protein